ncbi:hypothetical protein OROHE_026292 [Orobanche hederae]
MEVLLQPEQVEGGREGEMGRDVLIRWKNLPQYEATWEPVETLARHCPEFNLEDKVRYVERARPLIILHNLASKWFFQPNSFEPTKELLTAFLSVFGPIRYLDVSKDQLNGELCTASVQYFVHDEFINALKILCCCSLRQEHSLELVDYEVTLGPAPCGIALAIHPVEQEKIVTRMRKLKICEDQDTLCS